MGKRRLQRIKTKQGKRINTNNVTQGSISRIKKQMNQLKITHWKRTQCI